MKKFLALSCVAATLLACGGSDDHSPAVLYSYQGTLAGNNCFTGLAQSTPVRYAVTIDALSTGSAVTVRDDSGVSWMGEMSTPSSFRVTNSNVDPRMSIAATDLSASGAQVVAVTSCVSFRCCTSLSGTLHG